MTLATYLKFKRGRSTWLAGYLGVSPATISMWASGARRIPAERCFDIHLATNIPMVTLRRDLFRKRRTSCTGSDR